MWRWLKQNWSVLTALSLTTLFDFAMRWSVLNQNPYPPSGDAGGDLYLANAWLGHGIPILNQSLGSPPIYFVVVVAPLVAIFGPFLGIKIYMALIPSLFTFPAFLIARELGCDKKWSVYTAFLMGSATAFSIMVTWNGAYNALGILEFLFFIYFLARSLRTSTRYDMLGAAIFFAVISGTHMLTFVVTVLTLLCYSILALLKARSIASLSRLAYLWVACVTFALPFILLFYLPMTARSVGLGVGSYSADLLWFYSSAPYFVWTGGNTASGLIAVLDETIVMLGILTMRKQINLSNTMFATLMSSFVVLAALPLLSAENATRVIYFLSIPSIPMMALFFNHASQIKWRRRKIGLFTLPHPRLIKSLRSCVDPAESESAEPHSHPLLMISRSRLPKALRIRRLQAVNFGVSHLHRVSVPVATVIVVAMLVAALNIEESEVQMSQSAQYYQALSPQKVNALDWIKANTPPNATFFDMAGLQQWMIGYANRMDYAPSPLSGLDTSQSYSWARLADYIAMGSFLAGDSNLVIATQPPSPINSPEVFLSTQDGWFPIMGTTTSFDFANLTVRGVNHTWAISYTYPSLEKCTVLSNVSQCNFGLFWPGEDAGITEVTTVSSSHASIAFSASNVTLHNVSFQFGIPPSGYYYTYSAYDAVNKRSITDTLNFEGHRFDVSISSNDVSQHVAPSGWTQLSITNSTFISISLAGNLPSSSDHPFVMNTSALLNELKVNYAISTDYSFSYRLQSNATGGSPTQRIYSSDGIQIFRI